jgi:4-hydroxybenzoate polyprenyltransferase
LRSGSICSCCITSIWPNGTKDKMALLVLPTNAKSEEARAAIGGASGFRASFGGALGLCRPQQWAKNVFVLIPLLFSGSFSNPSALVAAIVAFVCFCFWSSAVYCVNDVLDASADRQHPRKCRRPVASGLVSPFVAMGLAIGLTAAATALAWASSSALFLVLGGVYLANSLAYCVALKRRVIVDVLSIAIGFVLRLLAGCAAIDVVPTSWILVCGFSLALLLGFGKRRLEVGALRQGSEYRPVLDSYSPEKLNLLLGVTATMCLLSYMLYTVAPETVALHHTDKLVYTVPFVAYGVFRYLFKVQEGQHDGPVEVLLKDFVFTLNAGLWVLAVAAVLFLPRYLPPWWQ